MSPNLAQRRAFNRHASTTAALLASRCYDYRQGGAVVAVTHPSAVAALARAFTLLLRLGGAPVAVPLPEVEAKGFPRWAANRIPDGVTWLAVGMDLEGRASYALQSAASPSLAAAHEAAKTKALAELARLCATRGFPIGHVMGRA